MLVDREGKVRHADAASCHLLGYSQEELLGKTLDRLIPDITFSQWAQMWHTLQSTRVSSMELRHQDRSGRIFPVVVIAQFIDYGQDAHVLIQIRDLTLRRKEEDLRLANLHFFTCMDQVNRAIQSAETVEEMTRDVLDLVLSLLDCEKVFLIYPCDPESSFWTLRMERARPGFCLGGVVQGVEIPTEEEVSRAFRVLVEADRPVTFGPGDGKVLFAGSGWQHSVCSSISQAIRPNIGAAWQFGAHRYSGDSVWTDDERQLFQEVGRRLSDALSSMLARRDLKDSERRYRRIVDTANEGICILDPQGAIGFVNPRMTGLLGYLPEEILGRGLDDLLSTERFVSGTGTRDQLTDRLRQCQGQSELCLRHRDGRPVWVLASASFGDHETGCCELPTEDLNPVVMFTDITAIKRAERELQDVNEQLEERVRDRTAQLEESHGELERAYRELTVAHTRLLQQEKLASLGELASGIAHEINTPAQFLGNNLSFLSDGFAEILPSLRLFRSESSVEERQDLDDLIEEIPHVLQESVDGVTRIAGTIRALKDFARTTPGPPQSLDLNRLISSTVEVTRAEWSGVAELDVDLDPHLPQIIGHRDDLAQVVLDLVINAVHAITAAGRSGKGRITLSTHRDREWVELDVADEGCGIPEELRYRIFEPFFTTSPVGHGRGMGLVIAYNVVTNRHGGELIMRSTPGQGSTFTVRLPVAGAA